MNPQEEQLAKRFNLPLTLAGPETFAPTTVQKFFDCLQEDTYPMEVYERVFGVEMKHRFNPRDVRNLWIGGLTYGAWQTLYKNDYITQESVLDALWKRNLPQFFEQKVREVYADYEKGKTDAEGFPMNMQAHVPELLNRGFNDIPWDLKLHKVLCKKIVSGIRVNGDQIIPEQIVLDSNSFEKCPIAAAAGIPLFVKKLHEPGIHLRDGRRYIISRMMSEPRTGLASPRWLYGGFEDTVAPPVLVARSDAISFTEDDWYMLDDFEMQMLDNGPRQVTRADFVKFAKQKSFTANVILEAKFPKGQRVRIVGLQNKIALNDKSGEITGEYENGRVGIKVDDQKGVVAVRPENLKLL